MRYNQLNEIRAIKLNKSSEDASEINLTEKDIKNATILLNDSELLRIVNFLAPFDTSGNYPKTEKIISLKAKKSLKKYKRVRDNDGNIKINDCIFVEKQDGKYDMKTVISRNYKRLLTSSSHTRGSKSVFVENDIFDKVDDILRCGISKDKEFEKISKWNSYYGLASTDSKVVSTPNIVVIDDFLHDVEDTFDVVHQYEEKEIRKYYVKSNIKKPLGILPFDGAGLVSVELANQWKNDINKTIPDNKPKLDYVPAAFQFRVLPGVKGNVYTFDIKKFSELNGDEIVDVKGIPHSLSKEKINCILTNSQFKFIDLFDTIEQWREEFDKPCHGYQRTFNISEYSEKLEELKDEMLTAYQPMQTLDFTDKEIESVCKRKVEKIKNISTDIDSFLKYRGLIDDEDNKVDWSIIPPYYKALANNKDLFADKYVQEKIKDDLKSIKNKALSAKLDVSGNYQVLTPDIYGLAHWAFTHNADKVTGLLGRNQIYSNYWNYKTYGKDNKKIDKVVIVRNPHIAHEWRIGNLACSDNMKDWYEYQTTGIITSMYDTILMALNSADTDGDHIGTIFDFDILNAIKRMKNKGKANTVDFKIDTEKEKKEKVLYKTSDIKKLMDVDVLGMSNSIGRVVDRVSILWAQEQTEEIQNYIKIMSVIASLTIDYAKTGEKAEIPREINIALKGLKKPYFMRYLSNQKTNVLKEKEAIENAQLFGKNIEKQSRFDKTKSSNVNRICFYMEEKIKDIELMKPEKSFDFNCLLNEPVDVNGDLFKRVKNKLLELHDTYSQFSTEFNIESADDSEEKKDMLAHYRYFFQLCRYELLSECKLVNKKVDKVLDIILMLYYTDINFMEKDKGILWSSFEKEMIARSVSKEINNDIDDEVIATRKEKSKKKINDIKKMKRKNIDRDVFDDVQRNITVTDGDIKLINAVTKKAVNKYEARKLLLTFLIFCKKLEKNDIVKVLAKDDGKCILDDDGNKIKVDKLIVKKRPFQIVKGSKTGINYLSLSKMTGIDRRKIKNLIKELEDLRLIKIYDANLYQPKIKVIDFDVQTGKELYSGESVLEAMKLLKKIRKTPKSK
ncbi:MAG: hypothetical protein WBI07_13445 [Mobilitalea sp.]